MEQIDPQQGSTKPDADPSREGVAYSGVRQDAIPMTLDRLILPATAFIALHLIVLALALLSWAAG